jgi:hypothetical protein
MNIETEIKALEDLVAEFALMLNTGKTEAIPGLFAQDGLFMPEGHKSFLPIEVGRRL